MKRIKIKIDGDQHEVELLEVKMVDGSTTTLDLMAVCVAANHGWLHPDEMDENGDPKWPPKGN